MAIEDMRTSELIARLIELDVTLSRVWASFGYRRPEEEQQIAQVKAERADIARELDLRIPWDRIARRTS